MRPIGKLQTLLVLGMFTISSILLTGCFGPKKAAVHESEISAQNVVLEDYLPIDTLMFMSINTLDESQSKNLKQILSYFPQNDVQNLIQSLIEEASTEMNKSDMSLQDDIMPIFSEDFRLVFGMAGEISEDEPDIYIAFTVADTEKTQTLMDKIAESNNNYEKTEVLGLPAIKNEKSDMTLVLYKDTVLVTMTDLAESSVGRQKNNKESVRSSEKYIKNMKNLPSPNVGTFYLDFHSFMRQSTELEKETGVQSINQDLIDLLETEAFAFLAQKDGIEMIVQVAFNPESNISMFKNIPYEKPYIFNEVPGNDLILYSEAYGLKEIYDLQLELLLTSEKDKEEFNETLAMIEKTVGLDMEKDILSWMDKGYALVIQKNDGIVPAISFYVDASSDKEASAKVIKVLDAAINQGMMMILAQADEDVPLDEMLKKDMVKIGNSEISRVQLDFSDLTDEELRAAGLPSGLFNDPLELYYGILDNNYFVLSTYSGLNDNFGEVQTVAENQLVKEGMQYTKDYPYGLTYFSVQTTLVYADYFIGLLETINGPMPKEVASGFIKLKQYLAPVQYIVSGNKKGDTITEGLMFMRVKEAPKPEPGETAVEAAADEAMEGTEADKTVEAAADEAMEGTASIEESEEPNLPPGLIQPKDQPVMIEAVPADGSENPAGTLTMEIVQ